MGSVHAYMYFSPMSPCWWAYCSLSLSPELFLPVPQTQELLCWWVQFGDRRNHQIVASALIGLHGRFCGQPRDRKGRMQPFLEWGGIKRTPAHIKVFSGPRASNFPQAAQNCPRKQKVAFHLFIVLHVSNYVPLLYFLLPPVHAAHEMETSSTSAIRWQSTIQKSCSPGYTPVLITPPFPPPSSLPLPSSDVSYTDFCWPETVSPSRQRPCLFCVFVRCCSSPWSSVLHGSSVSLARQSFAPSLTQNPTSKMHSNCCGSWISSSSKAECSINGMSADW